MKKGLVIILLSICSAAAYGQEYSTALGLRLGAAYGFTVKHFIKSDAAIEGILVTRWRGFYLTGLYEVTRPLSPNDNLYWYFGGGGHIGSWDGHNTPGYFDDPDDNYLIVGVDGILGMEYTFQDIPLNLSLDWKPSFNLFEHTGFWGDELALSVRFVLNQD